MSQSPPKLTRPFRIRVAETSLSQTSDALRQGPARALRQTQRLVEDELKAPAGGRSRAGRLSRRVVIFAVT